MDARSSNGAARRLEVKEWPTRRVALLVLSSGHLMSLAGPFDVFTRASLALSRSGKRRSPAYEVQLLTQTPCVPITENIDTGYASLQRQAKYSGLERFVQPL